MNEGLLQMVVHSVDPVTSLRAARKEVGLASGLLAWQLLRQPRGSSGAGDEVARCLSDLEGLLVAGKLNARESFIASAALSFSEGQYNRAAALLETVLQGHPKDLIALKLAQECYLAAGDSRNVLGCVARWMQLFDERSPLYGHVMGMFAAGLVEVGRLSEAEEVANRAVARTQGDDVWALHALLNTYQLLGRSSEVVAVLGDHLPRHMQDSAVGQHLLLFNKGSAFLQRGNYTGALRVHDDMVYNMVTSGGGSSSGGGNSSTSDSGGDSGGVLDTPLAGPLADATLLLWQVALHSPSPAVDERWTFPQAVSNLWAAEATIGEGICVDHKAPALPMHAVTQAMAFSAAAEAKLASSRTALPAVPDGNAVGTAATTAEKASDSAVMAAVEAKSKAIWEWFRHINNPALAVSQAPDGDGVASAAVAAVAAAAAAAGPTQPSLFVPPTVDHQVLVEQLLANLEAGQGGPPTSSSDYPRLSAIQPSVFVVRRM